MLNLLAMVNLKENLNHMCVLLLLITQVTVDHNRRPAMKMPIEIFEKLMQDPIRCASDEGHYLSLCSFLRKKV